MVEDAGTIQAEIRLNIDNLMKGAMEAKKAIKDMETEIKKSKAEINNAFREGTRAIFDYNVELKNLEMEEKTGSMTSQEASRARLAASQKYLDILIDVRNRIAEVNGEESKEVKLYDDLIKKQVELRDSTKKVGDSTKKNITTPVNDFSGVVKHATNNVKIFGVSLNQLGGVGTAIAVVIAVFKALSGFISESQKKSEELTKSLRIQRTVVENLGITYQQSDQKMKNVMDAVAKAQEEAREKTGALDAAMQKFGLGFDFLKSKAQSALGAATEFLGNLTNGVLGATTAEKEAANAVKEHAERYSDLDAAMNRYEQVYNNIMSAEVYGLIQSEEGNKQRIAAAEEYIQQLIEIQNNLDKNSKAYAEQNAMIDARIKSMMNIVKRNNEETAALSDQEKITQARTTAIEKYDQAVRRANDDLSAGLIDQEEHEKQIAAARAQEYADLEAIVAQYKLTTGETVRIRDETAAIVKNNQDVLKALEEEKKKKQELAAFELLRATLLATQEDILAEQAIAREREAGNIEEAIRLENELLEAQRKRERQAMEASDEFKDFTEAHQKEILAGYDAITEGMKKSYSDDTAVKIEAARLAALKKYDEASKKAHNDYARGLINAKTLQDKLNEATEAQYRALEDIAAEYDLIDGDIVDMADAMGGLVLANQEYQQSIEAEKERKDILFEQEEILLQQEIARTKEADLINLAIDLENQLINKQRQRAKEALMQTDAYILAEDDLKEKMLGNFDQITDGMYRVQAVAKKTSLFDSAAFKNGMIIGETAVSAFNDIASAMTEITRQQAEDAMAEIDRMLEETNRKIEEKRTHALEAAGFIEATTSESIQAQIDAAIEANDEVLQYQLERRQQEMAINEEYDAKAKAAQEKAARDKAEIEYKAAKLKYASDITSAIINGALAVTQAANNMWPLPAIPMMAAAGTATGAQLGIIMANPPKPPKFATGGIVPGQPHSNTDTVAAMLTPGEVILNRAQQESLAPQLGGDLYIDVIYDGEVVAKTVVENYVNKGRVLIDASRGIR